MSNARNLGNITTGGATGATTASVTTSINNLIDAAPGALNTLNELAAALGDDANFSTTVTNSIATKLPLAGGTLTGNLTITSGTSGDATLTLIADTDNNNEFDNPKIIFIQDGGYEAGGVQLSNNDTIVWNGIAGTGTPGNGKGGITFRTGSSAGAANATIKMYIDPDGKVGINTNNPLSKLHVEGDIKIHSDGQTTGGACLQIDNTNTSNAYPKAIEAFMDSMGVGQTHQIMIGKDGSTNDTGSLAFYYAGNASASNRLQLGLWGSGSTLNILGSGNVGIGTTTPGAKLQVDDGSGRNLQIAPSGSGIDIISTTNPMRLITSDASHMTFSTDGSSNERMRIMNTGNVGIGTTDPGQLLEVNGPGATIRVESTNNNQQGIEFYQTGTKNASIMWGQGGANLEIRNFRNDQNASNLYANIDFYTGGSNATSPNYNPDQAMRITDDQNVIVGGGGQTSEKLLIKTTQSGGGLQIAWSDGSSPTSGSTLGSVGFQGYSNGNSNASADAKIQATAASNHSGSSAPTHLDFYTKDDSIGPGSGGTRRFRIDEYGAAMIHASKNNWSRLEQTGNTNIHYRLFGASSSTTTYNLLRYRRHYWGSGSVHFTLFQTYYSTTSQGEYWLSGHGRSDGSYNPSYGIQYQDIYNGPGSGRLSINMPGGAPGNSAAEIVDVSISIPAYVYYLVKIQVSHSTFYPTTTVMGANNSYALFS